MTGRPRSPQMSASAYSVLLLLAIFFPLAIARFAFRLRVGTVE